MSAHERPRPFDVVMHLARALLLAIITSAALSAAALAGSGVVTTYGYDATGHLTTVAETCSTAGYTYCVGSDGCYNLSGDPNNCGSCGHACGSSTTTYYTCSGGACAFGSCKPGYYNCCGNNACKSSCSGIICP